MKRRTSGYLPIIGNVDNLDGKYADRTDMPRFMADVLHDADCARSAAWYYRRMLAALHLAVIEVIGDSPEGYDARDEIDRRKIAIAARIATLDDPEEIAISEGCWRNAEEYLEQIRAKFGLESIKNLTSKHLSAASVADCKGKNNKVKNNIKGAK